MAYSTPCWLLLSLGLLIPAVPLRAEQDEKKPAAEKQTPEEKKAQEEGAKKSLEEFNEKIKEAKTIPEKALAILTLGDSEPKDNLLVPPLAKYLGATPGDINYVLVTSAAEALGKFRGSAKAAAILTGALAGYKKTPYVASKIAMAIGRVGHESSIPLYEEQFKGSDIDVAVQAVWAVAEFPPGVAVDTLFRENDRIEKERKKPNLKDEIKKVYDRVQPEILKAVKKITAQPWPTMGEQAIWWGRHAKEFKEQAAAKEKEKKPETPGATRTALPPVLLVELLFKENAGNTPSNSGASGGAFEKAQMTANKPAWTTVAAPNGGPSALDFDKTGGVYAVDLGAGAGIENIKNLKSFTITGWTICWEIKEGPSDKMAGAGNRIVSWFNSMKVNEGVELVYRTDGSLQLGIGQWADAGARSKPMMIPLYDSKTTNAGAEQYAKWKFFAVTYDSGLASNHVKFYFGSRNEDAKLSTAVDYNRGPSGSKISPTLSIGNVPPMIRPMAPERSYRGILDEIRVYGSTLDGSGALPEAELVKIQNRVEVQVAAK